MSDSRHLRSLVATGLLLPSTKSVGAVVGSVVGVAVRPLAHTVEQREMFTHRTLVELVRHLCHASFNDPAVTYVTGSFGLILSVFAPASFRAAARRWHDDNARTTHAALSYVSEPASFSSVGAALSLILTTFLRPTAREASRS